MHKATPAAADSPADRRRRTRMQRDLLGDCAPAVRHAMASILRHHCVSAGAHAMAYDDCALPIGSGQTISQPRVVAQMISALHLLPGETVLDVGAGSGYAALVLARILGPTGLVLAVERQGPLASEALAHIDLLRDERLDAPIQVVHGDAADAVLAVDAIHIACAMEAVPVEILGLLKPGGRLIAPLGPADDEQTLIMISKQVDGTVLESSLGPVRFVPFLSGFVQ